jgi:uncharacterized protein YutE (UPF0331/DUF86 family)
VVDEGRVSRLLRGIDERVDRLDGQRQFASERRDDPLWLDGVKYSFVTAIEGCVDVAHHLGASERWGAPDTNAAAFTILARHGVIDGHLAERMAQAVGFRNVLVHQYLTVDDDVVVAALDDLDDLAGFVRQVSVWLVRREH